MNISGHWGGSLSVLNFGPDRIRTLVSMATDSSHRVIMGNFCDYSSVFIFDGSSLFLQVTWTTIKSRMGLKFGNIRPGTEELAAPEYLKKSL